MVRRLLEADLASGLIRAFVALPIPVAQRELLATYLATCAEAAPALRWVPPGNLHLTLRFLGNQPPKVIDALRSGLAEVRWRRFELVLGPLGTFGGQRARVVWLGLASGVAAAQGLAAEVEGACQEVGLEAEARPFRPHLTLARARERAGSVVPELPPAPTLEAWRAERFVLYRSRLGSGPALYEELESYPLGD